MSHLGIMEHHHVSNTMTPDSTSIRDNPRTSRNSRRTQCDLCVSKTASVELEVKGYIWNLAKNAKALCLYCTPICKIKLLESLVCCNAKATYLHSSTVSTAADSTGIWINHPSHPPICCCTSMLSQLRTRCCTPGCETTLDRPVGDSGLAIHHLYGFVCDCLRWEIGLWQ